MREQTRRSLRVLIVLSLAAAGLAASPASASAVEYYVAENGSDSNPGTSDRPWRTLGKGLKSALPGDRVYVRPGRYGARGTKTVASESDSGTAGSPITIQGIPGPNGEKPSILGWVRLKGSYMRLTGLSFDGPTGPVQPPTSANPSGEQVQVAVYGANVEIDHSVIQDSLWHAGVYVSGAESLRLVANLIRNNGDRTDSDQFFQSHGIYFSSGSGLIANNVIEDNLARGIQLYKDPHDVVIKQNTIVGNGKAGIFFGSNTKDSVAVNNIVAYNGDIGIRGYSLSGSGNVARNNLGFANTAGDFKGVDGKLALDGNFSADPLFVDPESDYHLRPGSGALDKALGGSASSIADDFDGVARPQGLASDVGAYERPASAPPECQDGIDNDGDGNVDYPADPDCSSATEALERPDPTCTTSTTVKVAAQADSWIDQNSSSKNAGTDSILKVRSQSGSNNFRSLVRFALPAGPPGCGVASARLRLYSPSWTTGRTLHAYRLAGAWSETGVTWSNQPATTGSSAATASGSGYREWLVTAQLQAMYTGSNNGFLIRDAVEGGSGVEQSFHSREKGSDNPPQLLVTFGP